MGGKTWETQQKEHQEKVQKEGSNRKNGKKIQNVNYKN